MRIAGMYMHAFCCMVFNVKANTAVYTVFCNNSGWCAWAQNLSAPYIVKEEANHKKLMQLMPYVDYLFGNETEARVFADTEKWNTKDVAEIARRVSSVCTQHA